MRELPLTAMLFAFVCGLPIQARGEFTPESCADVQKVAEETVELELAGMRGQGNPSQCLKQSKFKLVLVDQDKIKKMKRTKPEITLPRGRTVKVLTPVINATTGIYSVDFFYSGKTVPDKKTINVKDGLKFILNNKGVVRTEGCARLMEVPTSLSVREECR